MSEVLDNTPTASGRLIKRGKTKVTDDLNRRNEYKFRMKGGTFIEKNTHRIDTSGELQGITVKGYLASQRKATQRRMQSLFLSSKKRKSKRRKQPKGVNVKWL